MAHNAQTRKAEDGDIRIGNASDALAVMDEIYTDISKNLPVTDFRRRLIKRLAAVKDAITRNII